MFLSCFDDTCHVIKYKWACVRFFVLYRLVLLIFPVDLVFQLRYSTLCMYITIHIRPIYIMQSKNLTHMYDFFNDYIPILK